MVAWNHVSPSQIEAFVKCNRAWYFRWIVKIQDAQKGSQALGSAFHLHMEKTPQGLSVDKTEIDASPGEWAKADALARIALPLLPKEVKPIRREFGIRLPTYDNGPTMVGYIDVAIPPGVGWPAFLIPDTEGIVGDYKTLSDFRYMRTPQELASSVQMGTYAKWAIEPGGLFEPGQTPEYLRLLHVYAKTRPPFSRASIRDSSAIITPVQINSLWENTLDTVRKMDHIASTCTHQNDVTPNGIDTGHCDAYGGCSFRDRCGIKKSSGFQSLFQIKTKSATTTPTDSTGNIMSNGSNLLEKLKLMQERQKQEQAQEQSAAAPAAPTAPVVAATPAPSITTTPVGPKGPICGLLDKIAAKGKGLPGMGGALASSYGKEIGSTAQGFAGSGELGSTTALTITDLLKLAQGSVGVVPPDAPPRTQEVITRPGEAVAADPQASEDEDDEESESQDNADMSSTTPEASTTVSNVVVHSTSGSTGGAGYVFSNTVPPVKKRGRPSAADIAAREAAAKQQFDERVRAEAIKMGAAPDIGQALESMEAKLREVAANLLAMQAERDRYKAMAEGKSTGFTLYVDCYPTKGDKDVTDYFEWIGPICRKVAEANSVNDYRLIDYHAKGLLASAIRATVQEHGLPSAMTVSSMSGGADVALEVLTPLAKRVIKRV